MWHRHNPRAVRKYAEAVQVVDPFATRCAELDGTSGRTNRMDILVCQKVHVLSDPAERPDALAVPDDLGCGASVDRNAPQVLVDGEGQLVSVRRPVEGVGLGRVDEPRFELVESAHVQAVRIDPGHVPGLRRQGELRGWIAFLESLEHELQFAFLGRGHDRRRALGEPGQQESHGRSREDQSGAPHCDARGSARRSVRRTRVGTRIRARELDPGLADVTQPLAWVPGERAPQELVHARRKLGQLRPVGLFADDGRDHVGERLARERALARQTLVQHAPEGPDVRAPVHGLAARLLGAHVGRRTQHESFLGHEEAVGLRRAGPAVTTQRRNDRLGEPEVEQLDHALGRDANVRGLEVAVNDAGLVRRLEPLGDLPTHVDGLVDGQRSALQPRLEVLARHELHREEACVAHLVDAEDPGDVRVVQRRERLGLALETPQPLVVLGEVLGQHFDRNIALEARVFGAIDLAHPSGPEGTEDLVEGKGLASGEGHEGAESSPDDPDPSATRELFSPEQPSQNPPLRVRCVSLSLSPTLLLRHRASAAIRCPPPVLLSMERKSSQRRWVRYPKGVRFRVLLGTKPDGPRNRTWTSLGQEDRFALSARVRKTVPVGEPLSALAGN